MRNGTEIRSLTSRQLGLVSTNQLSALGVTSQQVTSACRAGELERLSRRVLRIAGAGDTVEHRVLAAVLDAGDGAVLSQASGAAAWALPGYHLEPPHVTRLRGQSGHRSAPSLGTNHQPRLFLPHHCTVLGALPVLRPAPLLWSLATSGAHPKRIERALDTFLARRLLTPHLFQESVFEFAGRGRRGSTFMRQLAAARPPGSAQVESGNERRFEQLLERYGEPRMLRQIHVGDAERWLGRVDFFDPKAKLIVQIDGDRFHQALLDRRADAAQTAALIAAGFTVLRITEWELWHCPAEVIQRVREARRAVELVGRQ